VVDKIGMMDEGYFMYYDDIDYCRRANQAGWKTLYWPEARVVHLRGGSGPVKTLTQACKRRPKYLYASRARYFAKFYRRTGLWTANMCWEIGRAVSWTREVCGNKHPHTSEREPLDIWTNGLRPLQMPKVRKEHEA
jgi:N-acetylglucosaminyl-diphospho-decaprenol L-rhamnosyltransferase